MTIYQMWPVLWSCIGYMVIISNYCFCFVNNFCNTVVWFICFLTSQVWGYGGCFTLWCNVEGMYSPSEYCKVPLLDWDADITVLHLVVASSINKFMPQWNHHTYTYQPRSVGWRRLLWEQYRITLMLSTLAELCASLQGPWPPPV